MGVVAKRIGQLIEAVKDTRTAEDKARDRLARAQTKIEIEKYRAQLAQARWKRQAIEREAQAELVRAEVDLKHARAESTDATSRRIHAAYNQIASLFGRGTDPGPSSASRPPSRKKTKTTVSSKKKADSKKKKTGSKTTKKKPPRGTPVGVTKAKRITRGVVKEASDLTDSLIDW